MCTFTAVIAISILCCPQIVKLEQAVDTSAERLSDFDDSRNQTRLVGSQVLIHSIRLPSRALCAGACSKNPSCLSINFCNRETCDLNREDIYSTMEGATLLKKTLDCKYLGMRQNTKPFCMEMGSEKDIRDDLNPGKCKINNKRVDREWGEWEEIDFQNLTEWKRRIEKRLLLDVAHGGIESEQPLGRVLRHFR